MPNSNAKPATEAYYAGPRCSVVMQQPGGSTTLDLWDVEGEFLGLMLTEKDGLNMRRVGLELHATEDIQALQTMLTKFLQRRSAVSSA